MDCLINGLFKWRHVIKRFRDETESPFGKALQNVVVGCGASNHDGTNQRGLRPNAGQEFMAAHSWHLKIDDANIDSKALQKTQGLCAICRSIDDKTTLKKMGLDQFSNDGIIIHHKHVHVYSHELSLPQFLLHSGDGLGHRIFEGWQAAMDFCKFPSFGIKIRRL